MKDDLGDRIKTYEKSFTSNKLDSEGHSFVYARIDGRGFSKFTKGMQKPFDIDLQTLMIQVTEALVKKTHAIAGYTQSDEISLIWNRDNIFFDGKIQKLSSILASMATSHFIIEGLTTSIFGYIADRMPHFDARVFDLPDEHEATNALLWRYNDAYRNAIQSIGQANFSHKQLHKKSIKELEAMLASIGIFKNDFSDNCIHGTFIKRISVEMETARGIVIRDNFQRVAVPFLDIGHENRLGLIFNK